MTDPADRFLEEKLHALARGVSVPLVPTEDDVRRGRRRLFRMRVAMAGATTGALAVVLGVTSLTAGDPKATEPPPVTQPPSTLPRVAEQLARRRAAVRTPGREISNRAATAATRTPSTWPATPAASTPTTQRPRPRTPRTARPPAAPPRTTGPAPGPRTSPAGTHGSDPSEVPSSTVTVHDADRHAHLDTDRDPDRDAHRDAHGAADPDSQGPGAPGAALLQRRARRAPRPRPPAPAALQPQARLQGDDDPRRQALRPGLDLPLGGRPLAVRPADHRRQRLGPGRLAVRCVLRRLGLPPLDREDSDAVGAAPAEVATHDGVPAGRGRARQRARSWWSPPTRRTTRGRAAPPTSRAPRPTWSPQPPTTG